ncbi:hypothetical protein EVAR_23290_1 [Eumeta japonica]|uniref:Uncharacterized protein n=1 Tax=Eumeta variegata TaxID=151549 RepID=A0A4C1V538_EUMVA|nr:hypothetical protein EVAR_23290_1 [Eumeta japonica]
MDELSTKCLLYTDEQMILAASACELLDMERIGSSNCGSSSMQTKNVNINQEQQNRENCQKTGVPSDAPVTTQATASNPINSNVFECNSGAVSDRGKAAPAPALGPGALFPRLMTVFFACLTS